MLCHFCQNVAVGATMPPLCSKHLDLAVFTEYLADQGQEITVAAVQGLIQRCHANNGFVDITLADVPTLLPPFLDAMPEIQWSVRA